ncbi:MAG: nucleotidyltransferase family protein [Betaproteobacteria bacterium]|nr:nucleotidyltransferase family protein [Betaproteobacteria bacterium]
MRAIILSAGRGVRLRPLTDSLPKPLAEIGGEPLLVRHVRRLRACGICDIAVNISHLGELIKETLGDGGAFGVRIRYSAEQPALETAGGIRTAMARGLLPEDTPFLAINADIVCDINFAELEIPAAADCFLLLADNPPQHPAGDFSLNRRGFVIPPAAETLTFCGVGIYRPQLFLHLPPNEGAKLSPILSDAIRRQKAAGKKHNGLWHDAGTPKSLAAARTALGKSAPPERE